MDSTTPCRTARYPAVKRTKTKTEMLTVLALAGLLNKACKPSNQRNSWFFANWAKKAQRELIVQCNYKAITNFCPSVSHPQPLGWPWMDRFHTAIILSILYSFMIRTTNTNDVELYWRCTYSFQYKLCFFHNKMINLSGIVGWSISISQ